MLGRKALGTPLLLAIAAIVLLIVALVLYTGYTLSKAVSATGYSAPKASSTPRLSASVPMQDLLYTGSGVVDPYLLIAYNAFNTSLLNVNASVFSSAVPRSIYILNTDNECFNCGNSAAIDAAIVSNLLRYGVISSANSVNYLNVSNLSTLQPDSLLVVLTGLLPSAFLSRPDNSSNTLMLSLLNRGTSIVYAGQNFSRMLLPGSIVVPTNLTSLGFLATYAPSQGVSSGYYFNSGTFAFSSGVNHGALTYELVGSGAIVAFPNTPSSWGSASDAGHDVAEAIQQLFWLGRYSSGSASTNSTIAAPTGSLGLVLSPFTLIQGALAGINNSTVIVAIRASSTSMNSSNTAYKYIYLKPHFNLNGSMLVPQQINPGSTVPVTMTIFMRSKAQTSIQPHITVYTLNMLPIESIPLPFTNASGNFTFINYINFGIGPGTYIAMLRSFTNVEDAAALFSVPPISIALVSSDISKGVFTFLVTSNGRQLSGIRYSISINGAYPGSGTLTNGTLLYALPAGTPAQQGRINFTISMLGSTMRYTTATAPTVITINKQYIELGIDALVAILIVLFIRAPNRDEFYIDVPALPAPQKTTIELKPNDLISVFGKLNLSYHWRFMPLSLQELHAAIMGNIRYNNMPVSLTYSNIEMLLNKLTVSDYLVEADNLYAPKEWEKLSNHDIEYLSTFKKLRLFLVMHAYVFTDLDMSGAADIVATLHGERKYIVIYSNTSKFRNMPVFADSKSYLVFLNSYRLEEFRNSMYQASNTDAEELKAYISAGMVRLVDADNPADILS
jgi:hypothetical protein